MALLLGLAMLPAGAIAMQVGLAAVSTRQAAYEEALGRRALESVAPARATVDELREMMRVLSTTPQLPQIAAGDCRQWLGEIARRYAYVNAISVSNDRGDVLCSVPTAPSGMRATENEVRRMARGRDDFAVGFINRGALTGLPVLAAIEPLRAEGAHGFVGVSVSSDRLRALLDRGRAINGARIAIVDASGRIVAESTPEEGQPLPGLPAASVVRNHLGPNAEFVQMPGGGAVVVPLYSPDLFAVVSWTPDPQERWRRWAAIAVSITAPLLIWLIAIGAGWFAIEVFVARPLFNLESAARAFARGEDLPDPPALRNAPEEIRSLRRTLAAMAKTLRGREQRLIEALAEERALLREVHHRVKNNLQMVASLLNIQARSASEAEAHGLGRAHERVQLLALVHQRIYTAGVHDIRLDELCAEIARHLMASRQLQAREVTLNLHLSPAVTVADQAVPLAFMIGESISHVLDGAVDAGPVKLDLWVSAGEDREILVAIEANLPPERAAAPSPSARLIDAFARQLGANLGRGDPALGFTLWARVPPAQQQD